MAEAETTLQRTTFRRRWRIKYSSRLRRNDLLPALGLLELSNALDFAANVWNTEPPPTIAKVFMALGATGALIILAFAAFDLSRAWRNIVLLRKERREIFSLQDSSKSERGESSSRLSGSNIKTLLDLNHRELGNEAIDRFGMGVLLGFGALTVGIGTYLAIDGANPTAFLASNIITGYVGNVPAALFGITNAVWAVYGWRRAGRHARAAVAIEDRYGAMSKRIRQHSRRIKFHALVNGIDALLGGGGSLMTASAYIVPVGVWGYVILFPAAITVFALNIYWRKCLNYERECGEAVNIDLDKLLNDANHALKIERLLSEYREDLKPRKISSRNNNETDRLPLLKLLIAYYNVNTEWLASESERLAEIIDGMGPEDCDKEDSLVLNRRVKIAADLATVQDQIKQANIRLSYLRTPTEKQSELPHYIDALFDFLSAIESLPYLVQDIANDSKMSQLFPSSARELNIKPSVLRQQLADKPRTMAAPFLNLTCKMLANKGLKQARSRVRYFSELCGSALSYSKKEMLEKSSCARNRTTSSHSDQTPSQHHSKPIPLAKVT